MPSYHCQTQSRLALNAQSTFSGSCEIIPFVFYSIVLDFMPGILDIFTCCQLICPSISLRRDCNRKLYIHIRRCCIRCFLNVQWIVYELNWITLVPNIAYDQEKKCKGIMAHLLLHNLRVPGTVLNIDIKKNNSVNLFILFFTSLGLCCCAGFSLIADSGGHSLAAVLRRLTPVSSLVAERRL